MKKLLMVAITTIAMVSCSKSDIVTPTTSTNGMSTPKRTTSVQCVSNTQSGVRCKNMTLSWSSKCYTHGGN
jgi:hypothetical protein